MTCEELQNQIRLWDDGGEPSVALDTLAEHLNTCRTCCKQTGESGENLLLAAQLRALPHPSPGDVFWQGQMRQLRRELDNLPSSIDQPVMLTVRRRRGMLAAVAFASVAIILATVFWNSWPLEFATSPDETLVASAGSVDDVLSIDEENADLPDWHELDTAEMNLLYRQLVRRYSANLAAAVGRDSLEAAVPQIRRADFESVLDEVTSQASDDEYRNLLQDLEEVEI